MEALCAAVMLLAAVSAPAQQPAQALSRATVNVLDETGVAVPGAAVQLVLGEKVWRCETDFAGRCVFYRIESGTYSIHVQKPGFYRVDRPGLELPTTNTLDVTLPHEQEIRETVNVTASPPAIDPAQTSSTETLTQTEILNVPYPTSRDIRQALPLMPGVVMDRGGNIFLAGSSRVQTVSLLDGFDVSEPADGFLNMRTNADSVRTIDVETSRFSTQYGRGDSVLAMNTGMGDDRFRFAATNFLPSFQTRKGLHFNQWVPRATFSGPLKRGRIWFFEAPEMEWDQTIIKELPDGQDRAKSWRTGNLLKLQANVTSANILTGEFIVNNLHAPHAGLSATNPLDTTTNQRSATYMGAVKDQQYFKGGTLLELGLAVEDFSSSGFPQGTLPLQISPEQSSGSAYLAVDGGSRRVQGISNVYLPPRHWHGQHNFQVGADLDHVTYHRIFTRTPIEILRESRTAECIAAGPQVPCLARLISFSGPARAAETNLATAGYAQDRWSPRERVLVEGGVRVDWDEILRTPLVAPRLAATYMLSQRGDTKLSAGVGMFYAATDLERLSRPQTGVRFDQLFLPDGVTPNGAPRQTRFFANPRALKAPRSLNWSLSIEHRLPHAVYAKAEFLDKRVSDRFLYVNTAGPSQLFGDYVLTNGRQDHYHSVILSARHSFRNTYPLMISYTRSSAHTNSLFDTAVDSITLGPQHAGPLPWDAPNRIQAWGWAPFVKKIEIGYALDWHSGFPFTAADQQQFVFGIPDSFRFPRYFSLTVSGERRFHVAGTYLALRLSVENVTDQANPASVNNNHDSPHFLTFSGTGHRTFTGRIRFLGRSKAKDDKKQQTPQGPP